MDRSSRFRIGGLEVDSGARRIRGGDGEVRVEPKVFDLLVYFSENPGRVIGQDELLEAVWGRRVASDAVVTQAIFKLRQLFKDSGGIPDALVTLRGAGYRLDVAPEPLDEPDPTLPSKWYSDWRLSASLAVLCIGLVVWWQVWQTASQAGPRIALLELENATGNTDLDWARAGAPALLGEQLARHGVEVMSNEELRRITRETGDDADLVEAAVRIGGVDRVFAPRLVPEGDEFRLELVSLADQSPLRLELVGSGPATLSLAMAGLLAEELRAPLRPPAGSLGLGNPFLDEAYARAYHHSQSGEFQDARELYEYILREAPDAHWARYHLSITLRYSGEMDTSRSLLESLLEEPLEDAWLTAAVRSTMGNLEWYAGNLDRAENYYLEAREIFSDHDMSGGVASTLANLGMVAFSRAEYEKGRDYARQALEIYRGQGNQIQQARLLHNIGHSYYDQGDFEEALNFLERAHGRRVDFGLRNQAANTRTVIAEIAIEQGRLDEGVILLEQSLATFTESDNPRGIGRTLTDLAKVAHRRGDYERARTLALESLTMAQARNEAASAGQSALVLGRSLHALGDYHGAEQHYLRSADTWARLDNAPGRITCLAERMRLSLDRGDEARARALLAELEPLAVEFGDERYLETLRALRLRLRMADGDLAGIESDIDDLLGEFNPGTFDHAELMIEIAEALHEVDPGHPVLEILIPIARDWAPRYFPAARLIYAGARNADQCRQALDALEQLRGADRAPDLPASPVCDAG